MKKPMLLSNDKFNLEDLDYTNMYISIKRDGVRAEVTNEGIKNRSLKILRNKKIQEYFEPIYKRLIDDMIWEAEIYCDDVPCREMAGICNSKDKDVPPGTKLYIFGMYDEESDFKKRNNILHAIFLLDTYLEESSKVELVKQTKIDNYQEAKELYDIYIRSGYEGAVLMDGRKKYKQGRVTIKQHIGFKLKPSREDDLEIIGVTERLENTNESQKNELGQSFKRNTVDAKKSTGIAGTFICKFNDTETKVTITGTEESRREIWNNKEDYIGKFVVCESMDYGAKDRPRHPRMIGIKEAIEK